jgi:nucleoside-diphosphate-sugar epimerase
LSDVTLVTGDITDAFRMLDIIEQIEPQIIIHLAALHPHPGAPIAEHSQNIMMVNVQGTMNIVEAVRRAGLVDITRVFFAGSSMEYGRTAVQYDGKPIPETAALDPVTPFGLSKATAEKLALQYFESYNVKVIVGRLFPVLGKGSEVTVDVQYFCKQIASIEASLQCYA